MNYYQFKEIGIKKKRKRIGHREEKKEGTQGKKKQRKEPTSISIQIVFPHLL